MNFKLVCSINPRPNLKHSPRSAAAIETTQAIPDASSDVGSLVRSSLASLMSIATRNCGLDASFKFYHVGKRRG
jgi:hypothetical protein